MVFDKVIEEVEEEENIENSKITKWNISNIN